MLIPIPQFKKQIHETTVYLKKHLPKLPKTAIMLGSGLGGVVDNLEKKYAISYRSIPNLPKSTVSGHAGQLMYGIIGKSPVIAFQGRWHHYEGIPLQQATFYVRVLRELGVERLVVTNAAGGLQKGMVPGDIMLITDHINMMGANPLIGPHDESFGPRFVDLTNAYDRDLGKLAKKIAIKQKIKLKEGIYVAVSGPNYESQAELAFMKVLGASSVGMSTVPEVIVARQVGLKVLGFSAITDVIKPGQLEPVTHEEVLQVAHEMGHKFSNLIVGILKSL